MCFGKCFFNYKTKIMEPEEFSKLTNKEQKEEFYRQKIFYSFKVDGILFTEMKFFSTVDALSTLARMRSYQYPN